MAGFNLNRITSRRVRRRGESNGYRNHYVMVPVEWAEKLEAEGYTHVQVSERASGTRELVLTPIHRRDVERFRREQRRDSARARRNAVTV